MSGGMRNKNEKESVARGRSRMADNQFVGAEACGSQRF